MVRECVCVYVSPRDAVAVGPLQSLWQHMGPSVNDDTRQQSRRGWARGVFGHAQKHGLGSANVIKVMFGDN